MSNDFSPREIVSELDQHIVGQQDAKRAVAIALRNRWRRLQLPEALREEVLPKNILMIGPTGCGKTEIARRLAKLANAPFLKVEATKFTEVGYVGRDVEQIVRDLMEAAHRHDARAPAQGRARQGRARRRGSRARRAVRHRRQRGDAAALPPQAARRRARTSARSRSRSPTSGAPMQFEMPGQPGASVGMINIGDMLGKAFGGRTKKRKMTRGRSPRDADARGERQAARPGEGRARGARHRSSRTASSSSTRSTRSPRAASSAAAATSAARACSATCCR